MLLQTDARRRITLPPIAGIKAGDVLDFEMFEDGRIMLIPVETVPRHQLWAWTPESKQAVSDSLADPRSSAVIETPEQASATATRWTNES
jgi:hypothetical protein